MRDTNGATAARHLNRRGEDLVVALVCTFCGKARADDGAWVRLGDHRAAVKGEGVSHGMCPVCRGTHYAEDSV